jgi:ROK family
MAELLDRRLVREVGIEHAGAIGRPRRAVALDGAHVGVLGLEINVDYVAVHGTDLGGHLPVDPGGHRCGCGRNGCWETKVGLAALVRMVTPDQAYGLGAVPVLGPEERVADIADPIAIGSAPGVIPANSSSGPGLPLIGPDLISP